MIATPRKSRSPVIWSLLVCFLLQPFLTYLTTPAPAQTREGLRVVVCTLQGLKEEVFIELPAIDGNPGPADECPAVRLIQLAGVAQIPAVPAVPPVMLYVVGRVPQTGGHSHHRVHFSAYSSRAPPVV